MISEIKRKIADEYEYTRNRKENERILRVSQIYEKYPDLSDLKDEINRLGLENTKNILKNPENAEKYRREFNEKLKKAVLKRDEFILKNNIDPEFDKIKYDCKLCEDRGYLENGEKCRCYREKVIKYTYKSSNLSEVMKDMSFKNFSFDYYTDAEENGISERKNMEYIIKGANDFCSDFDNYERNILFYGAPGLGKTFVSVSIARELIEKGKTVIYVSATKLFSAYEDFKFGRDNTLEDFLEDIYKTDLLIIDDLGTECSSKVSVAFLFDLVNDRILNKRKVIINTNLFPDELEKEYSERFMSRVCEYFDVFKFFGRDIRIQKQYK